MSYHFHFTSLHLEQAIQGAGGSVEAMYYFLGGLDVVIIVDLPDNLTVTAASLIANASGTVKVKYSVLLSPEEIDKAAKTAIEYRPPGQ